jgi:prevent-host-death family protein
LTNLVKVDTWADEAVNLYEAKTGLSALVEQAAEGEEIVIAKNGKPKAKLVANHGRRAASQDADRNLGSLRLVAARRFRRSRSRDRRSFLRRRHD